HFVGRISRNEVEEWYSGSDALLFTSERETLGLPLIEAMQFGLPVIAPRLPYAVELLGDAGCYFDEGDPASVAQAIAECQKNLPVWRKRSAEQLAILKKDSYSWRDHWKVLL